MTLLAAVYCKLLYKRQTTQLGQLERRAIEALVIYRQQIQFLFHG